MPEIHPFWLPLRFGQHSLEFRSSSLPWKFRWTTWYYISRLALLRNITSNDIRGTMREFWKCQILNRWNICSLKCRQYYRHNNKHRLRLIKRRMNRKMLNILLRNFGKRNQNDFMKRISFVIFGAFLAWCTCCKFTATWSIVIHISRSVQVHCVIISSWAVRLCAPKILV